MIVESSKILKMFIEREVKKIENDEQPHMPILGTAYEKITEEGINFSGVIPEGAAVKMVSGQIMIGNELIPNQIDSMLVFGKGKRYGLTDTYKYPAEQVLAIFEVKKTLNGDALIDAIEHLHEINIKIKKYFMEKRIFRITDNSHALEMFKIMTKKHILPETKYSQLSGTDREILNMLVNETSLPMLIIHGYGGYSQKTWIKKGFESALSKIDDFDINGLPSLITTPDISLVKGMGFPYRANSNPYEFPLYFSTFENQAKLLLECIWSKISERFNCAMPWGDNLKYAKLEMYLSLLFDSSNYNNTSLSKVDPDFLKKFKNTNEAIWTPVEIKNEIFDIIKFIAENRIIKVSKINEICEKYKKDKDSVVSTVLTLNCFDIDDQETIRPFQNDWGIYIQWHNNGLLFDDHRKFEIYKLKNNMKSK